MDNETILTKRPPKIMPLEKRLMLDAAMPAIAGNVFWIDAADATTILDGDGDNAATGTGGANNGFGGTVGTWRDKSGSNFHVTNGTATERPSYGVNTRNGKNVVTFDGTNDKLTNTLASIPGDDYTAFVVFNRTTAAGRDAIFELGGGGSRNAIFINDGSGANKINYYVNGTFYNPTPTYTANTYVLTEIVQNGTSANVYNTGVSQVTATTGLRASTTGIYVGDDSSSGDQLQGHIAELIVFDRDLTTDERRDVENYLATKWGFTLTNAAPTVGTNTGVTLNQGAFATIANTALSSVDTDNSETYLRYTITDAVDFGTLTNTNTLQTLTLGSTFRQSDLDSGYIRYTHNNSTNFSDSFSFTVSDGYAATAAQTFNFTMIPTNNAPQIQGWSLVSNENFETGATGWSNNTTTTSTPYLTQFLGRFSQDGGTQNVFKTYSLSGTQDYAVIRFDMYKIDSWDGESFRIFINDSTVFNVPFTQNTFNTPVDGTSGIVSYTVEQTTPFLANFAFGAGFNDQSFRFTLTINTTAASVKLGFSSTLDQAITDEAWGVDNVSVYEVSEGGTVGPFEIVENSANGTVVGRVTATDLDVADTLSYSIIGGTGAAVFAINPSTGVVTVTNSSALNYESVTSYTIDVRVTDNGAPALSDTKTITINVLNLPENTAPTINPIGPLSVNENAAVNTVIGSPSATDPEGDTLTWNIVSGNTDNIFGINGTNGQLRISSTANLNAEWANTYTLVIGARDNGFGTLLATRSVVININSVNEAPTFNIPQSFLNENPYLRYNATTGNFYRYISTTTNYATATSNAAGLLLNGVAGHLATISNLAENTYVRGLGGGNMWIGGSDSVTEGSWVWAGNGPEGGNVFSIGAAAQPGYYTNWNTGEPNSASAGEDFIEMNGAGTWNDVVGTGNRAYVVEWEGSLVLAALGNGPFTIAENPTMGQVVGSVHARDADVGDTITYSITGGTGASHFAVNPTSGQITVTNPSAINFETATSYTLNLRVQDVAGLFNTQTVTINITDINETPVLNTNTGVTLNEGAFSVISSAMLSSSDQDAPPDSALIYTLTGAVTNGTLVNTNTSATLTGGSTFTQGDIDNGYIRYTHNDSETTSDSFAFSVSDGFITLAPQTFSITVNPVNDNPVFVPAGPFSIAENSALASVVGSVTANDPDIAEVLTYSITGGTGLGVFAINGSNGQITLNAPINFEGTNTYTLNLRVQDVAGLFSTQTVTINITDANDIPTALNITGTNVTENVSSGTLIGLMTTIDEDPANTHTYSLVTNPGGLFAIVGNQLVTNGAIDYELASTHTVTLRTNDGNGGIFDRTIVITVNDLADSFTPPPSSDAAGGSAVPVIEEERQTSRSVNILDDALFGGGLSGFYGTQILRDNVTMEIMGLLQDGFEKTSSLQSAPLFDAIPFGFEGGEEIDQPAPKYTNLREALLFLEQMKDSIENTDENETDTEEGEGEKDSRANSLPLTPLDQQFVDVMTYHKDRSDRLRAALMG